MMQIKNKWDFGDDKKLAENLKRLVLSGKKVATTGLYQQGYKVPTAGDFAQILGINKKPFCTIQYTKVEVKPFLEVGYNFAELEGEGHKDIEEWREAHRKFFRKESPDFNDYALVVCEEFKLV